MAYKLGSPAVLKKIEGMERELAKLKRDVIHTLPVRKTPQKIKPSLFGSVRGRGITEKIIEQAKHNLFRNLDDL